MARHSWDPVATAPPVSSWGWCGAPALTGRHGIRLSGPRGPCGCPCCEADMGRRGAAGVAAAAGGLWLPLAPALVEQLYAGPADRKLPGALNSASHPVPI